MTESHPGHARSSGPTTSSAFKLKAAKDWSEYDLRDYIVTEIQERNPVLLAQRRPVIEISTCKGFINRHGAALAVAIAHFAFERMDGIVTGRPVHFGRFVKASDPYFAKEIIKMLPQAVVSPPADAA